MSQIEVPKVVQYVLTGAPADNIAVAKVAMYVWMMPGDDGSEPASRQAHVYAQKITR